MATKKAIAKKTANNKAAAKSAITKAKRTPMFEPKILTIAKEGTSKVVSTGAKEAGGFITFIREQGVVGLAVGVAIGTAAGAAVKQIVDGFINPIIGFIIGGVDLTKLKWVIVGPKADGTGGLTISWGAILSALITLVATSLVIYALVRITKLDRLNKQKS
ncbi:MAG: MscL family protein [Candidatus Microsaccharimonas sossegonensis]|uniref:MscL family protein n=1 Tax=Candidatus Microsaccharimonas sossegonensis TaxID=2506948 RepID=A0A4V1J7E6_9BACT|nr:MAG: MscL family protein [Candidatus Microsaccharimonas sossegonensis]